jgi:3-methyladenine DNA glycosylase/8-oxoguanine DNA glycosylase
MAFDDEPLIEKLIESPGIGRWTAEMFLLFGLAPRRARAWRCRLAARSAIALR